MLVEVLSVVNNDKLHLFQFINSVGVACHVTAILTLAHFKKKLSECVMAVVVITSELYIFATLLGVDLAIFYSASNELI